MGPTVRSEANRLTDAADCRHDERRTMTAQTRILTAPRSRVASSAREQTIYRQLKIVAGIQNDRGAAIAYRSGKKFLEAQGDTAGAALDELMTMIDELHAHREAQRPRGVPSPDEYLDALLRIDRLIDPMQRMALYRHAGRPDFRGSFSDLAHQLGTDPGTLEKAYARLGRYLADVFNFHPQAEGLAKALQPIVIIAEPIGSGGEDIEWRLQPGFLAALHMAPAFASPAVG
jgi:hypothetical protein